MSFQASFFVEHKSEYLNNILDSRISRRPHFRYNECESELMMSSSKITKNTTKAQKTWNKALETTKAIKYEEQNDISKSLFNINNSLTILTTHTEGEGFLIR